MSDTRKRPWLAAVLALIYPGLGHVYLRAWHRAILWFAAVVFTGVIFVPNDLLEGVSSFGDLEAMLAAMPLEATIAISLIAAFNVVDAYWTAKRTNATVEGVRCPYCGKQIDEDLSFCHWCTSELVPSESEQA